MQDVESYEQGLISCLLQKPEQKKMLNVLKEQYFSNATLGGIYSAITPTDKFPQIAKRLQGTVSFKDLTQLLDLVKLPTLSNTIWYGRFVLQGYKDRVLEMTQGYEETSAKLEELKKLEIELPEKKDDVSEAFLTDLERIYRGEPDTRTLPTGYLTLDGVLRGFRKSELIIIGGRPAMGKTTLGVDIAYSMAKDGKKVAFFSLEMAEKELHQRLVKKVTGIENLYNISQDDFEKCIRASRDISDSTLTIYDKADSTVEAIYLRCQQLKERGDVDAIFIDHLSILKSAKYYKNRYEEISDISRQLKVMAKDLDVPVVALCQLNRGVEAREVKVPTMADLRDSGSIEQDADLILFIHRPEYYVIQRGETPDPQDIGKALISVCKNRRGGVGCAEMSFNPKIPTFY